MAAMDSFDALPVWQKALMLVATAGIVIGAWYFMFYDDAVQARIAAERALTKVEADLEQVKKQQEDFLERQRKFNAIEEQLRDKFKTLPRDQAAVDLIFLLAQNRANSAGLVLGDITKSGEQVSTYYARVPMKVVASGTWAQLGEYFRQISELDAIINIDNLVLKVRDRDGFQGMSLSPKLDISFDLATFRYVEPKQTEAVSRRRQGGKAE